ncbi:MAG: 2-amino-4-hydroxy-6-hydroxymethyldihydropteridine diphosphokinase [Flavobacteriales bacterium]|nr:2-amino-4-hydroxy-6-hydroxymethyldihydropteridine diphosphokinase [Flavobacteriales bacterium]MCB9165939.1 2-amino-4-hydroxy-6-hydroxymethyldihydropteridine diphosphokinase [Flavobacteriales bacterium]
MCKGSEVLMLLGADLGDPPNTFSRAEKALEEEIGRIRARSRDHWTHAEGFDSDLLFLNRALVLTTDLAPEEVLRRSLGIEIALGRVRVPDGPVGPRVIDLDILLIGELVVDRPGLRVPHPRMHQRAFALGPAADIVPGLRHPLRGRTVLELLRDLHAGEDAA